MLGMLLATAWGQGPKLTVCWTDCWGAPAGGGAPQCPAVPWGTRTPARLQRQVAAWNPAAQLPAKPPALPGPQGGQTGQTRSPRTAKRRGHGAWTCRPRPRPWRPLLAADPRGQKMCAWSRGQTVAAPTCPATPDGEREFSCPEMGRSRHGAGLRASCGMVPLT